MKRILIADDDPVSRNMLSRALEDGSGKMEILTSEDGNQALNLIRKNQIDLVVSDYQIQSMDGMELVFYLNQHYSDLPVFVMTAFGTPEIKEKIEEIDNAKYFEKPINIKALTEAVFDKLKSSDSGSVNGISLTSYLQIIEREKENCTIVVKSGKRSGKLYFESGELMSAETRELKDEKAAYEIISWKNHEIIRDKAEKKEKRVKENLTGILVKGLKLRDQRILKDDKKKHKNTFTKKRIDNGNIELARLSRLTAMLGKARGVLAYGIYDQEGLLREKHADPGFKLNFQPLKCLKLAAALSSSPFQYLVMNTKNKSRYIMFNYSLSKVVVAATSRFKPEDFVGKINSPKTEKRR